MNEDHSISRSFEWFKIFVHRVSRANSIIFAALIAIQIFLFMPTAETLCILSLMWVLLDGVYFYRITPNDLLIRKRISRNTLVTAAIILTQIPVMAPFWALEPTLYKYAAHLATEVPMLSPPGSLHKWCGIYYVHNIVISPNQVEMDVGIRRVACWPNNGIVVQSENHLIGYWYDDWDAGRARFSDVHH